MMKLGFTVFAAAVLALPLCAEEATFRVDVPFEFSVRNTTAPAGTYDIRVLAGQEVQLVVGNDCYFLHAAWGASSYTGSHEAKLVFHRYGNQYFLSQVATTSTSLYMPTSRVERELKKTVAAAPPIQPEILLARR